MAVENITEKIRQLAGTNFGTAKPALKPLAPRGARPEQTGVGTGADGRTKGSGGGIASPLTETSYAARTYHDDDISLPSSDGLFTLVIKPVKSMKFKDADGAAVIINLAKP